MYPIDPVSEPKTSAKSPKMRKYRIDAAGGIAPIGIGIGFPEPELNGEVDVKKRRLRTHMAVELPLDDEMSEEIQTILGTDAEEEA